MVQWLWCKTMVRILRYFLEIGHTPDNLPFPSSACIWLWRNKDISSKNKTNLWANVIEKVLWSTFECLPCHGRKFFLWLHLPATIWKWKNKVLLHLLCLKGKLQKHAQKWSHACFKHKIFSWLVFLLYHACFENKC